MQYDITFLVDTSASLDRFEHAISEALVDTERQLRDTLGPRLHQLRYYNFATQIIASQSASECVGRWQHGCTNLAGAFHRMESDFYDNANDCKLFVVEKGGPREINSTVVSPYEPYSEFRAERSKTVQDIIMLHRSAASDRLQIVVLLSDGEHFRTGSNTFHGEKAIVAQLVGLGDKSVCLAIGFGDRFPTNQFLRFYRDLYNEHDSNSVLDPVIPALQVADVPVAFQQLLSILVNLDECVKPPTEPTVDLPVDEMMLLLLKLYAQAARSVVRGDVEIFKASLRLGIDKIVKFKEIVSCRPRDEQKQLNVSSDSALARLRGMLRECEGKLQIPNMSNAELQEFVTAQMGHRPIHTHNRAAERRYADQGDVVLGSLLDYLCSFSKCVYDESEQTADVLSQCSEEDMMREAQLRCANFDPDDEPLCAPTFAYEVPQFLLAVGHRIRANRPLIEKAFPTIKHMAEGLITLPCRGLMVRDDSSDSIVAELWLQWIVGIATVLPTANLKDFIGNGLVLSFRGERINSAALWARDPAFLRTAFAQKLTSWLLTRNLLVHNREALLIQYGIMAYHLLLLPLSEYHSNMLKETYDRFESVFDSEHRHKGFERFMSCLAGPDFRRCMVSRYEESGVRYECGGAAKLIMALLVQVMRRPQDFSADRLVQLRNAWIAETYYKTKRDCIKEWFIEDLPAVSYNDFLGSLDFTAQLRQSIRSEEAVLNCTAYAVSRIEGLFPETIEAPKHLYTGKLWGVGHAEICTVFNGLAQVAGLPKLPAITAPELMGILVVSSQTGTGNRANYVKDGTATDSWRPLFKEHMTQYLTEQLKAVCSTYTRDLYHKYFTELHDVILPISIEDAKRFELEHPDKAKALGISPLSGLFTTACSCPECPWYAKTLGPVKLSMSGVPMIISELHAHVDECSAPSMHVGIRRMPGKSARDVTLAVLDGEFLKKTPDGRAMRRLLDQDAVDTLRCVQSVQSGSLQYESWSDLAGSVL